MNSNELLGVWVLYISANTDLTPECITCEDEVCEMYDDCVGCPYEVAKT